MKKVITEIIDDTMIKEIRIKPITVEDFTKWQEESFIPFSFYLIYEAEKEYTRKIELGINGLGTCMVRYNKLMPIGDGGETKNTLVMESQPDAATAVDRFNRLAKLVTFNTRTEKQLQNMKDICNVIIAGPRNQDRIHAMGFVDRGASQEAYTKISSLVNLSPFMVAVFDLDFNQMKIEGSKDIVDSIIHLPFYGSSI